MGRLLLLFNTIRYLKLKQIYYQLFYRIRKKKKVTCTSVPVRGVIGKWPTYFFNEPSTLDGKNFTFLGETKKIKDNWNPQDKSKLWQYNLHYHDFLNSKSTGNEKTFCSELIDRWIASNPPFKGNGWEPYCLSLRLVNWIKFFSRYPKEKTKPTWIESLTQQTFALEQKLEFHILGNHLFANAKALVFAGVFFEGRDGERWLKKGLHLIRSEIEEQFLDDGAHYERSPMYHSILLWDIADLICLQQISNLPQLNSQLELWKRTFIKGLEWLRKMVHPDGQISFFNDATFGISPTLNFLEGYAALLGLSLPSRKSKERIEAIALQPSGYAIVDWLDNHKMIMDVGEIGPDYQPGHAHADTLSCELSLFGHRVLVNSGISQYGIDEKRLKQRSTALHNTVEVDKENSTEVWSGFRVARRARPFEVNVYTEKNNISITASHDGYKRLPGKVIHRREWLITAHRLSVEDQLEGKFNSAVAHWHFHPAVKVVQEQNNMFVLYLPGGSLAFLSFEGGDAYLKESYWYPGFGTTINNKKVEVSFLERNLRTVIRWGRNN